MNGTTEPKDFVIKVSDTKGQEMSMTLAWDTTYDEWKTIFKTVLTFLEYGIPADEKDYYERNDE